MPVKFPPLFVKLSRIAGSKLLNLSIISGDGGATSGFGGSVETSGNSKGGVYPVGDF